jgi:hypothetical protein
MEIVIISGPTQQIVFNVTFEYYTAACTRFGLDRIPMSMGKK